jgi:hypothetical protein
MVEMREVDQVLFLNFPSRVVPPRLLTSPNRSSHTPKSKNWPSLPNIVTCAGYITWTEVCDARASTSVQVEVRLLRGKEKKKSRRISVFLRFDLSGLVFFWEFGTGLWLQRKGHCNRPSLEPQTSVKGSRRLPSRICDETEQAFEQKGKKRKKERRNGETRKAKRKYMNVYDFRLTRAPSFLSSGLDGAKGFTPPNP